MKFLNDIVLTGAGADLTAPATVTFSGLIDTAETNAVVVNSSGVLSKRVLGSNAFSDTTIPTNNNQLTNGNSYLTDSSTQTKYLRSDADDTFSGGLVSSARDEGIFGTYDSYKTDHIWSMGTSYKNNSSGADFGNLYGLAYKHTNNTTGGTMAGGHQMVWCSNGNPQSSLGTNIWTGGSVIASALDISGDADISGNLTGVDSITASATVQAEHLYSTDDLVVADDASVGGDLTVSGTTYGIYHSLVEDGYYHDDYNGSRNLSIFYKNARADIIRYQAVDNYEYWNGSAWVADASQEANVEKLLDGRQDTSWYVPERDYKFRFTTNTTTGWPTQAMIWMQQSWTGSTYPGCTVLVEETADATANPVVWVTKVTAEFTSANGNTNWGLHSRADTALHTGNGNAANETRITVDFYGWSPSNASYVTIPLQNLMITSNFGGTENTDYTNLLSHDKHLRLEDNRKFIAGTGDDLKIFHDGSNSYIEDSGTGHLNIKATNLQLLNAAGNKYYLTGADGNDVKIFHNGVEKFTTVAGGVEITGELQADTLDINGSADILTDLAIGGDLTVTGKITQAGVIDREEWGRTYTVNTNSPLPLLTDSGAALPTGGAYRMTGHISTTGSEQVAMAVFWNENGTWYINKTFEGGTSSNHVEFKLLDHGSGTVPTVTLESHATNYNVQVAHERLSLDEDTGTDNLRGYFGSDSYLSWLETTNTLTVPGDVTVSGGDLILGGTGRIQGIDTVTDGTDAANKTYVDTAESDAVATAASANKAWSTITGTPTTIAAYGITDALVIGTTGTTALAGNTTIPAAEAYTAHENITAATSVNGSGRTYIQDITVDSNGHVTGIATASETVTDTQNSQATTRAMFSGSGINTSTGVITNTTYGYATAESRGVITVGSGLSVTAGGVLSVPAIEPASSEEDGKMSSGDKIKLDAIEALADKTDATNVAAAGASMKTAVETISGAKTFSAAATMSSGLGVTGDITVSGTVDGIDIATDVAANTAKTGISAGQTSAITANTAKNTSSNVYGSTIKLIPSDFETSGDGGNTKFGTAFDKTAGQADYGMRTSDSTQEVFAFVSIPEGMKATHVQIFGRRTKDVEVFEVQINATTVVSKGTGICTIPGGAANVIAITNVSSTATNLLAIEVLTTGNTTDRIYGGVVTIAAI